MLRFYVRKSSADSVKGLFRNPKFTKEPGDAGYFEVDEELMDPTADLPNVPSRELLKVTFRQHIFNGFLPDGIYYNGGGEMLVETTVGGNRRAYGEHYCVQRITLRASTVEVARVLYTLARQKKLVAAEKWADEAPPEGLIEETAQDEAKIKAKPAPAVD